MQVLLPDVDAGWTIHPAQPMSEDEYFEFCTLNQNLRIERTAEGEILVLAPPGFETGYRNSDLTRQLGNWARQDVRGLALDSNTEYVLPNGAARSPDASWVLRDRLAGFTKKQLRKFLPVFPDFVVELVSPSDRLPTVQTKMLEWMENGAALGWLLDPDRRTLYVYRPGQDPEKLENPAEVRGEGIVEGFRLELNEIWAGL